MLPLLLLLGQLVNPSFDDGLEGWTLETGAKRGDGPVATPVVEGGELKFVSDAAAREWRMALRWMRISQRMGVLY